MAGLENSMVAANRDRFAAQWLASHKLTKEAKAVLRWGAKIYEAFYANAGYLNWPKYKISLWDCGWYQIRKSLKDNDMASANLAGLAAAHKLLGQKILPELDEYGILSSAEHYFEDES